MKHDYQAKPGHLAQFGPLHHPQTGRGPVKGGNAYQYRMKIKAAPPAELGWKPKTT